jgi:hypothetical protein
MQAPLRLLIDCFLQALDQAGEFPHRSGLRDFQVEHKDREASVYEWAALALQHFCIRDGRFNGYLVGVTGVVRFLAETTDSSPTRQALQDLRDVLEGTPTAESLVDWAKGAFPA